MEQPSVRDAMQEFGRAVIPDVVERVAGLEIADDVKENVDILCGYTWPVAVEARGVAQRVKRYLRKRIWMEYAYGRSLWLRHSKVHRAGVQPVDVLVTLVPYHENYKELLYPVVEALDRRNISVALFLPVRPHKLEMPSNVAHILSEYDVQTIDAYRRAKTAFAALRSDIDTLVLELGLNQARATSTAAFFQRYSWEWALFQRVLELTRPRVVFGLHFTTKPGYLKAIRGVPPESRPSVILMQHGSIFSQQYLDFKGADKVILWGDRSRQLFPGFSHLPTPGAAVIGNPSLAKLLHETQQLTGAREQRTPNVFFIANARAAEKEHWDAWGRQIFVSAAAQMESFLATYRPHPSPMSVVRSRQLWRAGHLGRCQLDIGSPLAEALSKADVVVGTFSTGMLEAIAAGVPVVQLIPDELSVVRPDVEMVSASSAEELARLLDRLIGDASYREAVVEQERQEVRNVFGDYENAAERIADEIDAGLRQRHA